MKLRLLVGNVFTYENMLDANGTLLEFGVKRTRTLENIQKLTQEAQAVSSVIENPDVAQALRQDKLQNLQYLKDTYGVRVFYITAS